MIAEGTAETRTVASAVTLDLDPGVLAASPPASPVGKTGTKTVTVVGAGTDSGAVVTTTVVAPDGSGSTDRNAPAGGSGDSGGSSGLAYTGAGLAYTGASLAGPIAIGAAARLAGLALLFLGTQNPPQGQPVHSITTSGDPSTDCTPLELTSRSIFAAPVPSERCHGFCRSFVTRRPTRSPRRPHWVADCMRKRSSGRRQCARTTSPLAFRSYGSSPADR